MNVPNHERKAFRDMTPEERSVLIEWKLRGGQIEYWGDETGWYESTGEYLRFGGIYRTRPRQLVIPWEHIKEEIKFAFVGKSGLVYGCEYRPSTSDKFYDGWKSEGKWYRIDECININTTDIDWRESLTTRPEGV